MVLAPPCCIGSAGQPFFFPVSDSVPRDAWLNPWRWIVSQLPLQHVATPPSCPCSEALGAWRVLQRASNCCAMLDCLGKALPFLGAAEPRRLPLDTLMRALSTSSPCDATPTTSTSFVPSLAPFHTIASVSPPPSHRGWHLIFLIFPSSYL